MVRTRLILFRAAAVALGLCISLILCESVLRIVINYELLGSNNGMTLFMKQRETNTEKVFGTVERTGLFRLSEDKVLGWEPVPGAVAGNISINSAGFRGQEYPLEPADNKTRIVFLGDSETFGLRLKQDETVSGCLEYHLNRLSGSDRFEVLNFGVPGYNTVQEFDLLKSKAIRYNPSIVIIYYVLNDPLIANPVIFIKGGILSRSYLYMALSYYYKSRLMLDEMQNGSSVEMMYQRLHSSEYFEAVRKVIRETGDYCAERDIRFLLVIAPEVSGFEDWVLYPYGNIHQKLKHLKSKDVEVVDPLDADVLQHYAPGELWVTSHDCHKNANANGIIGEYIADYILRDGKERMTDH